MATSRFLQGVGKKKKETEQTGGQSRFLQGIQSAKDTGERGENRRSTGTLDVPGLKGDNKADLSHVYEQYKANKARQEAIERLTPKALTPPTQAGQTYSEKLAENRATAQRLSKGVPETAEAPNNINELIFGKPVQAGTVNPRISAADISTRYNTMTDKEKAAYAYLKSKEAEEADEYLKAIEMDINKRNTEKLMAETKQMATEKMAATPVTDGGGHANPTMRGFGYKNENAAENAGAWYGRYMGNSLPANLAATAYALYQGAMSEPVDPYHPLMAGQNIAQAQSEGFVGDAEGLAKDIKMAIPSVFDFGTNLLTGGALGLMGNALGNAVAGAFSAQAFAGAAKDTAQRDGTGMQSVLTGTVAATLAYAIEKIGFDRLAEIGTLKNGRGVISTLVKSMFSEGAEEGAEEAGNILADVVIMGDKNDLVQLYNEARANGATFTDAFNKATAAGVDQVVESARVGAIAGGMMGGGTAMVNHLVGGNVLQAPEREEADTPDTNTGKEEPVSEPPVTPQTAPQSDVTLKATNTAIEAETQPVAQQERASELPETERFPTENFYAEGRRVIGARLDATGNVDEMSGATAIYNAALAGRPFEEIRHKYATTAGMEFSYAKAVHEAGVKDRKADLVARVTGQGKLTKGKGVILEDVAITEGQKALANLVSKIGGMTVRIVDTDKDYNGWYERDDNEIVIALDSQHGFAPTLFHETVHFIRAANAEGYQRMQDAVFQMAAKIQGKPVEAFMEEYKARWESNGGRYKYGDVMEEMTADAMMEIAADEKGMKELISLLRSENPTVLEQIKEFLDKMLQTLNELVKDGRFNQWADAIHADIENTKKLRQMFAEELKVAGEKSYNIRTEQEVESNERKMDYSEDRRLSQKVQGEPDRENKSGRRENEGTVYQVRGAEGRSGNDVQNRDSEGRRINQEIFEKLKGTAVTDDNGNPLAVYHYTPEEDFSVFEKGDIGFHFGTKSQSEKRRRDKGAVGGRTIRGYLNIKNPARIDVDIMNWHANAAAMKFWAQGIITTEERKEIDTLWAKGSGYSDPAAAKLREILESKGYDGVVYQNGFEGEGESYIAFRNNQIIREEDSDIRFSLRETKEIDTEYMKAVESGDMAAAQRMVDAAAEEKMPDSVVRDERGNLKPVYHGTKDHFYEFDTSVKGGVNGTAEGFGIYTTDDTAVADVYGNRQLKMYADIKKPATSYKKTIKVGTLAKLIKDTCEKQANQFVNDGDYDSIKEAIMDTWVSNYVYTYEIGMEDAYSHSSYLLT